MDDISINLFRYSNLVFKTYLREAIQISKRAMLRVGFVPPPFRIQIDITDRCNFKCPTCTKWTADPSKRELRTHEWKTVFEKIRNVPLLREVTIGGGEPFMRRDIFDILRFAKSQNLYTVVISNGWYVDEYALKKLGRIGVDRLMVSLNSLRESVHDRSRGAPGSYKRIMFLIESWRGQPKITDLCLANVIMEPNCEELSLLASFVNEKGMNGIIYQVLAPVEAHYPFSKISEMPHSAPDWYSHNPLWVRHIGVLRREIHELLNLKRQAFPIINPLSQLRKFPTYYENPNAIRKMPCLGTLSTLYIDPFGDIRLCYGFPPIGNILRDNPRQLWRSNKARRLRLETKKCTRLCRLLNNNL
ncbi:MAG: radical SAM/SPASM domain-containing protein [Thermodesulfobacteriota bacterium]